MLRKLSVVAVCGLLVLGCQSNRSQDAAAGYTSAPIETSTATLVVHGMSCPLCANNVDKQLLRVEGVQDVIIDMGDGTVRVTFTEDKRPSRAQLARAIDQTGFTLVRINTP